MTKKLSFTERYLSLYIQNTLSCAKNDIYASEMVCMAQNEGIWAKYRPTKENHIQAFRIWFIRMEKSNSNEPNVCVCVHLMDISKNFPSVIAVIYTSCNICSSWLHHQFFWSKQPTEIFHVLQALFLCSVLIQSCCSRAIGIPVSKINDDPEPQELYPDFFQDPDFFKFWSNPRSLG